jgi:uncharacterized membrane protein
MRHFVKVYLLLLPIFLALDYLWLGVFMAGFYNRELGALARRSGESVSVVPWAAAVVYLLIPLGIVLFALPRVSASNLVASALGWGCLYGLVLYGVYDMTNYSVVGAWSLRLSVADIFWGGLLNALATLAAALLDRWLR